MIFGVLRRAHGGEDMGSQAGAALLQVPQPAEDLAREPGRVVAGQMGFLVVLSAIRKDVKFGGWGKKKKHPVVRNVPGAFFFFF